MPLRLSLLSLYFLFVTSKEVSAADVCSAEKLIGSCSLLEKNGVNINGAKGFPLPKLEDGSVIYNDLGQKRARKSDAKAPSPAQIQRAISLSEKIRKSMIEMVSNEIRSDAMSAEQRAMVARLKSVRITMATANDRSCNSSPVSKIDPNASYNQWTHTITICPPVARLAPSALLMLMAHEFGHVISPCAMRREQYSVISEKVSSKRVIKKCLNGSRDIEFAQTMFPDGATDTVLPQINDLSTKYRSVVGKLTKCGVLTIKPDGGKIQTPGVLRQLTGCLSKSYERNHTNYLKAERASQWTRRSAGPPSDQSSKECMGIYEEHLAEAVGSKVFAQMLEPSANKANDAKIGLVQMLGYACGERKRPAANSSKMFLYPTSSDRLQIQMSDPAMQQALDCSAKKTNICTLDEVAAGAVEKSVKKTKSGKVIQ